MNSHSQPNPIISKRLSSTTTKKKKKLKVLRLTHRLRSRIRNGERGIRAEGMDAIRARNPRRRGAENVENRVSMEAASGAAMDETSSCSSSGAVLVYTYIVDDYAKRIRRPSPINSPSPEKKLAGSVPLRRRSSAAHHHSLHHFLEYFSRKTNNQRK